MKDTTKAAAVGIAAGLTFAFALKLAKRGDAQKRLHEGLQRAKGAAKQQADLIGEEAMLQRARLTDDPKVNQRWVENQWETLT